MRSLGYIPSFYFYKFANAVAAPYTSLDAYRSGAIDESGNIISTEGSIDDFEYFVLKLKKIFEDLPPGITKSRLTNVLGLFQLFAEEVECIGVTQEQIIALTEAHVILNSNNELSLIELLEDMGTAGMSTGSAPGELGTPAESPEANKGNVSGYDPRMGEILTRNQPVNMFQGIEMFNVSPEEFKKFKQSKAWRHLPDSPTKKYLQRFQRRNKEGKIAVRDETSGDVFFIPYKEKSFMEEFNLHNLEILKEMQISNIPETETYTVDPEQFQELMKKNGITQVDPSDSNIGKLIRKTRGMLSDVLSRSKKAQTDEVLTTAQTIVSSAGELRDLRRSNPNLAADVMGAMDYYAGKDPSTTGPIDSVGLVRQGNSINPILVDTKSDRFAIGGRVPSEEEDYGGFKQLLIPGDDPFQIARSAREFTRKNAESFIENEPEYSRARDMIHDLMGTSGRGTDRPKQLSSRQKSAQEVALDISRKAATPGIVLVNRGRIASPQAALDYMAGLLSDDQYRFSTTLKRSGERIGKFREMEKLRKTGESKKEPRPFKSEPTVKGPEIFNTSSLPFPSAKIEPISAEDISALNDMLPKDDKKYAEEIISILQAKN